MSNEPSTAKAFENWEELAKSDLGKTVTDVVSDALVRGDVVMADPTSPKADAQPPRPSSRRPSSP